MITVSEAERDKYYNTKNNKNFLFFLFILALMRPVYSTNQTKFNFKFPEVMGITSGNFSFREK